MKLYAWTSANGYKAPIFFEELGIPYEVVLIDIHKGMQKRPEFLALNPNHKIPVLIDDEVSGEPIVLFESGAILLYLAEKYRRFLPETEREKFIAIEWLFFQVANIGPMFGQANHFVKYAPEKLPYAIDRYQKEVKRLMGVLETRLAEAEYLAGEYSIADMATWPWVRSGHNSKHFSISEYPHAERWYRAIESRDAVQKATARVDSAPLAF